MTSAIAAASMAAAMARKAREDVAWAGMLWYVACNLLWGMLQPDAFPLPAQDVLSVGVFAYE